MANEATQNQSDPSAISNSPGAGGRVTLIKNLIKPVWLYPSLVGILLIVLVIASIRLFTIPGGAGKALPVSEMSEKGLKGVAQPSRTLEMRLAVDGKELIDLNMKTNKGVAGEAVKEAEGTEGKDVESHEPSPSETGLKSVSEIEKEVSLRFKKHFESLLSKSTPLIELSHKFEKHSKDDAVFQEKTEKSLGDIGKEVKKISDKVFEVKPSSPSPKKEEGEKKGE